MSRAYHQFRQKSETVYEKVAHASWNPFRSLHEPRDVRSFIELERAALAAPDRVREALDEAESRLAAGEPVSATSDDIGLALSGGGIRSATFNLGVLQGLSRLGLLSALDYLSTVSGGGYIGGFWTRWRERSGGSGFPAAGSDVAEAPEIRALREHGSFLSPRAGLLSWDTTRVVVAVLAGLLPALAATLALLLLGLWAWHQLLAVILAGGPGSGTRLAWGIGLVTAFVLVAAEVRLSARDTVRDPRTPDPTPPRHRTPRPALTYAPALAAGLALVLFTVRAFERSLHDPVGIYRLDWVPVTLPGDPWSAATLAVVWVVPAVAIIVGRALVSRFTSGPHRLRIRSAFDRVMGRLLFMAAAWLAGLALWSLAGRVQTLIDGAWWGAYGAGSLTLAGIFGWIRQRAGALLARDGLTATVRERIGRKLPALLAWAVLILTVAGVAGGYMELLAGGALPAALVAATSITLLTLVFFDPNRVGLHSFYRSRIARTFLGASDLDRSRTTEEIESDDISLSHLAHLGRPLHLVCTTANDLASSDPLAGLGRGGCSAVLSPVGFSVGNVARRWRTDDTEDAPSLGAALTASAAAFNPMMGSYSQRFGRAAGFLMTALNLRLGRWVRHPCRRTGTSKRWLLPGFLFYRELFGYSSSGEASVHLSDGGHFENMAVYELIRRRCRYILASDCGADPKRTFNDLANLIRLARTDLGVEIRVDLSELRPDADGRSRNPVVAGDILYPDDTRGVLLLLKPGITGAEPPDVAQYLASHPAFPHETTLDQFYDPEQWESYRRLGEHTVATAFSFARGSSPWWPVSGEVPVEEARRRAPSLFSRARFRWLPGQSDADIMLAGLSGALAELDRLLERPENAALARQVNRLEALAAEPGAEAPHPSLPGPDVLLPAAGAIRTALATFERAYLELGLDARHDLPANLGLINRLRRWTSAPLVRFWWPVLKSRHCPSFVRFMEQVVELAVPEPEGAAPRLVARTAAEVALDEGYAAHCWRLRNPEVALEDADSRYILFETPLLYGNGFRHLQVGLLRYWSVARGASGRIALWNADDLFIADGLWGGGLGGRFLQALVQPDSPLADHAALAVLGAERQAGGLGLYWQTGFETYQELAMLLPDHQDHIGVRKYIAAGHTDGVRFLVRAVRAPELPVDAAPAGHVGR